jgi:uncharacterized protein YfiM (DUF2279 family)
MLILLTLILTTNVAKAESLFSERDKQLHMAVSAGLSYGIAALANRVSPGHSRLRNAWVGFLGAMVLGSFKEVLVDGVMCGQGLDGRDILANGFGSAVGATLYFSF